jgi:hypothetical protein
MVSLLETWHSNAITGEPFDLTEEKNMIVKRVLMSIAVSVIATIPGFASTIDLGVNGDADVGSTFLNFGNYPLGTIYTPAPGYGIIIVSQPPLGLFLSAGVTAGESGKIQSLNAVSTPPGVTLTPDPASALPFMTFDTGGSNLKLFLTELVPGNAAGPFSLTDSASGAVASFNIDGFIYNTTDNSREDITGTFSATFNGTTVSELIAAGNGPGVQTPFSGTLSVIDVPEPASLSFWGVVLIGTALFSRRRLEK